MCKKGGVSLMIANVSHCYINYPLQKYLIEKTVMVSSSYTMPTVTL